MAFKIKDLTFKIRLGDQEMEFALANQTDPVVEAFAATCGPTNPLTTPIALEYELGFSGMTQFDELKAELRRLIDEIETVQVEP